MRPQRLRFSAALAFMLCGCTSPQIRYHTLLAPAAASSSSLTAPYAIDVLPPGIPASLDLQQVVIRENNSSMRVLENDQWLSPLGDELRGALSAGISARLGAQDVNGLAYAQAMPVSRILVQLRRFDSGPGNTLTLDVDWSLSTQAHGQRVSQRCKSVLTHNVSADREALFRGWQVLVSQLANQIADTQTRWAATGYPPATFCP